MLGRRKKEAPAEDASVWVLKLRNDMGREVQVAGVVVGVSAAIAWMRQWESEPRVEAVVERQRPEPVVIEGPKVVS